MLPYMVIRDTSQLPFPVPFICNYHAKKAGNLSCAVKCYLIRVIKVIHDQPFRIDEMIRRELATAQRTAIQQCSLQGSHMNA